MLHSIQLASGLSSRSFSIAANDATKIAGWQYMVLSNLDFGPFVHTSSKLYPRMSLAIVYILLTFGYFNRDDPIPTNWLPCPGNNKTDVFGGAILGLKECFVGSRSHSLYSFSSMWWSFWSEGKEDSTVRGSVAWACSRAVLIPPDPLKSSGALSLKNALLLLKHLADLDWRVINFLAWVGMLSFISTTVTMEMSARFQFVLTNRTLMEAACRNEMKVTVTETIDKYRKIESTTMALVLSILRILLDFIVAR